MKFTAKYVSQLDCTVSLPGFFQAVWTHSDCLVDLSEGSQIPNEQTVHIGIAASRRLRGITSNPFTMSNQKVHFVIRCTLETSTYNISKMKSLHIIL